MDTFLTFPLTAQDVGTQRVVDELERLYRVYYETVFGESLAPEKRTQYMAEVDEDNIRSLPSFHMFEFSKALVKLGPDKAAELLSTRDLAKEFEDMMAKPRKKAQYVHALQLAVLLSLTDIPEEEYLAKIQQMAKIAGVEYTVFLQDLLQM